MLMLIDRIARGACNRRVSLVAHLCLLLSSLRIWLASWPRVMLMRLTLATDDDGVCVARLLLVILPVACLRLCNGVIASCVSYYVVLLETVSRTSEMFVSVFSCGSRFAWSLRGARSISIILKLLLKHVGVAMHFELLMTLEVALFPKVVVIVCPVRGGLGFMILLLALNNAIRFGELDMGTGTRLLLRELLRRRYLPVIVWVPVVVVSSRPVRMTLCEVRVNGMINVTRVAVYMVSLKQTNCWHTRCGPLWGAWCFLVRRLYCDVCVGSVGTLYRC